MNAEHWSPFGRYGEDNARCPVNGCRYSFPLDLETAARDTHARSHSREQWDEVVDRMKAELGVRRDDHAGWEAFWLAEMERARRWSAASGQEQ